MKRRTMALLSLIVVSVGLAALFAIDPERTPWMPKCMFHVLTGLYCPGCGTTRALHRLVCGDIIGAARFNLLTLSLVPVALYLLASEISVLARNKPLPCVSLSSKIGWGIAGLIVFFWIARNIPAYPFTLLAPH
jgi:hypothetical protein